jgi:NADH-dependent peroxiredoxin subunit C
MAGTAVLPLRFYLHLPTELEEAAEYYDDFKKEGAEILSVSTDTVFVHKAWHDNSPSIAKIAFPMIADPTARLCRYFGTYIEDAGLPCEERLSSIPTAWSKRWTSTTTASAEARKKFSASSRQASFVRQHQGEVCPASWKPGKKHSVGAGVGRKNLGQSCMRPLT